MRERIARALALDEYDGGYLSGAEIEACVEEDMRTSRRRGRVLLRQADAVLAAMREPSFDMGAKGNGVLFHGSPADATEIWQAMIDAARAPSS